MRPLYRSPLRPLFLLWWRLRERDVVDAGWVTTEGETKGPPSYQYGKVTGLDPDLRVITETTESPYVCCGYCSAGMACWTAKKGITHSMSGAAHPIRSASGRPHDNGSKASELRNGAKAAHGVTFDALARDEIPNVLRDGFAVVINLDYADLPSYLRVQSGSFGHSCCLYGWKEDGDYVGFFDPLWPEGAYGAWAKWADVKSALWSDGEHSGMLTTWSGTPPPEPPDTTGQTPPDLTPYDAADVRRAVDAAVVADDSADVVVWVDWLRAGKPRPTDAWDLGAWGPLEPTLAELVDGCGGPELPTGGARWHRGPLPDPVGLAYRALTVPATWDGGGWSAGLWL